MQTDNDFTEAEVVEDIQEKPQKFTLIQCFYGTDKDRIAATAKALQYMLRSDPMPDEWIFIEAQKSKSLACF